MIIDSARSPGHGLDPWMAGNASQSCVRIKRAVGIKADIPLRTDARAFVPLHDDRMRSHEGCLAGHLSGSFVSWRRADCEEVVQLSPKCHGAVSGPL